MKKCFMFVMFCLFYVSSVFAQTSVTVAWNASVSPDVTGYKIFWGNDDNNYSSFENVIDAGNVTELTIPNLPNEIILKLAATAYDVWKNESDFSIPLIIYINKDGVVSTKDTTSPDPPGELKVIQRTTKEKVLSNKPKYMTKTTIEKYGY